MIRKFRRERHMTQEQLAERAGLSVRTVQRVEAGSVSPSEPTLRALAEALDVPPSRISCAPPWEAMPEGVRAALRRVHEGLHELAQHMYEHPEDIGKLATSSGTYVFQPRSLDPDVHALVCMETIPLHNATLIEVREIRREPGPNPDGSGEPWIRRLCPGPTVSAFVDVAPWRPALWRATADFELADANWSHRRGTFGNWPALAERVSVREGDLIELVNGDRHYSKDEEEIFQGPRLVRVGEHDVFSEFDHVNLPVVPHLGQEREPPGLPSWLS